MYILINNDNVYYDKKLDKINKKLGSSFKKEDFKNFNSNYVLNVNNSDLDFKRDVNELNNVFVQKLYKKDNSNAISLIVEVITLIMLVVLLSAVNNYSDTITQVLSQLM